MSRNYRHQHIKGIYNQKQIGKTKKELKIFSMKLGVKQDYLFFFLEFKTEFINNLKLFDFSR